MRTMLCIHPGFTRTVELASASDATYDIVGGAARSKVDGQEGSKMLCFVRHQNFARPQIIRRCGGDRFYEKRLCGGSKRYQRNI